MLLLFFFFLSSSVVVGILFLLSCGLRVSFCLPFIRYAFALFWDRFNLLNILNEICMEYTWTSVQCIEIKFSLHRKIYVCACIVQFNDNGNQQKFTFPINCLKRRKKPKIKSIEGEREREKTHITKDHCCRFRLHIVCPIRGNFNYFMKFSLFFSPFFFCLNVNYIVLCCALRNNFFLHMHVHKYSFSFRALIIIISVVLLLSFILFICAVYSIVDRLTHTQTEALWGLTIVTQTMWNKWMKTHNC